MAIKGVERGIGHMTNSTRIKDGSFDKIREGGLAVVLRNGEIAHWGYESIEDNEGATDGTAPDTVTGTILIISILPAQGMSAEPTRALFIHPTQIGVQLDGGNFDGDVKDLDAKAYLIYNPDTMLYEQVFNDNHIGNTYFRIYSVNSKKNVFTARFMVDEWDEDLIP